MLFIHALITIKNGSNKILSQIKFELNNTEFILPDKKYPQNGFGIIGNLKSPKNNF